MHNDNLYPARLLQSAVPLFVSADNSRQQQLTIFRIIHSSIVQISINLQDVYAYEAMQPNATNMQHESKKFTSCSAERLTICFVQP